MMTAFIMDNRPCRLTTLTLLVALLGVLLLPITVSAFAGFGDYISERLLGDGVSEALYLGDGANDLTVLGSSPIASTLGATSSSAGNVVTMTMNGNLHDLNGMPRADVRFRWGYSPSAMVYFTAIDTVSSTGERTAVIYPNAGETVYYQFMAGTDGTSYGLVESLPVVGGGHGVSYWMLNTLLPIVVAGIILVGVLLLTGNPILALVAGIVGLAGFYIVLALVSSF